MKKFSKKMISFILMLSIAIGTLYVVPARDVKANTFKELTPYVFDDLRTFTGESELVWEFNWNISNSNPVNTYYAKFTLAKESIIAAKAGDIGSFSRLPIDTKIYSDEACTSDIMTLNGNSIERVLLGAGTYYIKIVGEQRFKDTDCTEDFGLWLGYMEANKAVNVKQKTVSNGKAVKVDFTSHIWNDDDVRYNYIEGKNTNFGVRDGVDLTQKTSFKVTKNGWYTIRITYNLYDTDEFVYYHSFKVTGIDTKAPTIKGIKNGKTYKKKVTGYVKDNVAIKQVKDGSKKVKITKVKSGKYKGYYKFTITKKGTHTLKVYDKAGNVKKITFKIK